MIIPKDNVIKHCIIVNSVAFKNRINISILRVAREFYPRQSHVLVRILIGANIHRRAECTGAGNGNVIVLIDAVTANANAAGEHAVFVERDAAGEYLNAGADGIAHRRIDLKDEIILAVGILIQRPNVRRALPRRCAAVNAGREVALAQKAYGAGAHGQRGIVGLAQQAAELLTERIVRIAEGDSGACLLRGNVQAEYGCVRGAI